MVLQAFVDDSHTKNVFVLAGNVASPAAWADFSKDWEELLPLAPLDRHGRRNFKMSEMVQTPERLENSLAFYRVIKKYVLCSFEFHFRIADINAARSRVRVPGVNIDWGPLEHDCVMLKHILRLPSSWRIRQV